MSNTPQLENGYTKIANEILESLAGYRIPGEQMQCLLFILRKTYGWMKKESEISLSEFVEVTGIIKPHVSRAIKSLQEKNIIIVTKNGNKTDSTFKFNKKYVLWKSLPKKVTLPKKVMIVTNIGNEPLPKKVTTDPLSFSRKKLVNKKKDIGEKKFVPPNQDEVVNYFLENGYSKIAGIKAYNFYHVANWIDSKGNQVKNWKQKMIGVWFKDENKIQNNSGAPMSRQTQHNMAVANRLLERWENEK